MGTVNINPEARPLSEIFADIIQELRAYHSAKDRNNGDNCRDLLLQTTVDLIIQRNYISTEETKIEENMYKDGART